MDQLTLPSRSIFFMSDGFGIEPKVYKGNGNNKVYQGVAVFRSGTFRDSMGVQATYEDLHMKQMIDNYGYLKNKNILSSVPVRDGHPGFIMNNVPGKGEVVGWHQNIQTKTLKSPVDGAEYSYLLADYEITQPYALEKINNGTWRNRSAEIGGYTTNSESEFWPVYMGFAFVDLPAVEGLNFSMSQGNTSQGAKFYVFLGGVQESQVTDQQQQGSGQGAGLVLPPLGSVGQHAGQQQPAPQSPQPFVFSMNGSNVSDPNAVQAYIRQLEGFVSETRSAGRKAYVAQLVGDKKLGVAQQPAQEAFALSLSDEQFAAWKAGWDAAAPLTLLANHGGSVTNPNGGAEGTSPQDQALADAESIVSMHERGGAMKPEDIKKTKSYQLLVAAGKRSA